VTNPPFQPDPAQQRILDHDAGPLLVVGEAGTGKTVVLRERFARLIEGGADPERVTLVSGSRRARDESKLAVLRQLKRSLPGVRVTTMQGLAHQLVSRHADLLGYAKPPRILDATDQFALVQDLLHGERAAEWPAYGDMLSLKGFADEARKFVLRAQEALLDPDRILQEAGEAGLPGWRDLAGFYRRYLDVLDAQGAVDFAGLVVQAAVAAAAADRPFDHVLVDDFQDTTLAAERVLARLSPLSLVVAGDPEAHVFSFQGMTDAPIGSFVERFGAGLVRLPNRHRGVASIDAWRLPHTSEEHAAVARELRRIHVTEAIPWNELAVVVRRNGPHIGGLVRALDDAGIPRSQAGAGLSASTAPATFPYILALRWVVADAGRRDDMVESVLTSELGGISPAAARSLLRLTRAGGHPPAHALEIDEGLADPERSALADLRGILRQASERRRSVLDAFRALWQGLSYSRRLVAAAETSTQARVDLAAVLAFSRLVAEVGTSSSPSIEEFLALAEVSEGAPAAGTEGDRGRDEVRVLTAHAAVGLEFDTVMVAGAVEGDFPSLTRPEPMFDLSALQGVRSRSEVNRLRLADERRLFRSATARARRRVVLTASDPHGMGSEEAVASRFVDELGVAWTQAPNGMGADPVSVGEAAAAWRRTLGDATVDTPDRLAAMTGVLALGEDPGRWWFQREWTAQDAPPKEHLSLSFSRLDRLENCELQFVLGDELGLDPGGGYQAWVGRLIHQLIEDVENGKVERTQVAFIEALNERWQEARFPSYAVSEAERRHAIRVLIPNWFERYADLPAEVTEQAFRFEYEGAVIKGKIDRIGPVPEGGRRITDYKTGAADNADRPAESLQLGIYYLAVNECDDLAPYRPVDAVELAYLPGKKGKWELVPLSWQVSGAEERYKGAMRERLSGLIESVRRLDREGRSAPSTTANCFFCRFQTMCSRYPEGGEVFPVTAPISLNAAADSDP
jgi:superfamily I DNA/RNA helicase